MTYAQHRRIIDADSHVIELDDFLRKAASDANLALLPSMLDQQALPVDQEKMEAGFALFRKRQDDPGLMAESEETVVGDVLGGWKRLGAFDPNERSRAMDVFGYQLQWVLPTFSFHQIAHVDQADIMEAGARTLNKAMGEFCAHDRRLKAIGYLPLSLGPEKALSIMNEGLNAGCYSFMVDTNEPNDTHLSFTHPNFDPVWARFCEVGAPFSVHVAANGHYKPVPKSFSNNGREALVLGGDAPPGELGLITIKNSVEIFLSAMIFDGVFERHPNLRGICMEHGAFWVPAWLRGLDFTASSYFNRRSFNEPPAATARRHLKFSPFAGEPVGWIIENTGPEMLVFASDFPHPEGSSDPIKKFEATMENCDQSVMDAFYYGNMAEAMGIA